MVSCRICIEQVTKPVSLPCGHIFCADCIVKSIRAVQHFTNFHPCPLCRSIYNIAPVNLRMVPPNLRAFVTPTIRRLHIDSEPHPPDEEGKDPSIASTPSDISSLQAENDTLRNDCVVWRKRAETQGLENLNLMKVIHTIQDQASHLACERDELQRHCSWLKHKLNEDESLIRGNATNRQCSVKTEQSLESLSSVSSFSTSPNLLSASQSPSKERHLIEESITPRKRRRIDS